MTKKYCLLSSFSFPLCFKFTYFYYFYAPQIEELELINVLNC